MGVGLQRSSVESGKQSGEGSGAGIGGTTFGSGLGEADVLGSKHVGWLLTAKHKTVF